VKIGLMPNIKLSEALDSTLRTRKDIAKVLGIALTRLSALVNGREKISAKMKEKFCSLLGKTEKELF